jgi:membrane-associated protease RseP (regulator of RpoE activity)
MITTLAILLGFGLLIGFHEAAHMLVSKLFGVKVDRFALGFGQILLAKKIGETSYELRLLPLGGFVKCHGEDPESSVKRGFFSLPWHKRALVALAGPAASLLLGFLILYGILLANGWPIFAAFSQDCRIVSFIFASTYKFFAGTLPKEMAGDGISGPVMIVKVLADSFRHSPAQFFQVLSLVSLSLGLFNLLPLPMLDGGYVFLYALEGIRGKKWSAKVYIVWNAVGMALLGGLMLYTVLSDIVKLLR